ncbi:MAG: hypothetical protein AB7N91_00645 [Candidatus Tectimicrobiota bacterium]
MAQERITAIFFLPPLAIARLGGADTPLESFLWADDPTLHGSHTTVIEPAVTFEVQEDGSLRTYIPTSLRFRDGERLRPVAPFFELWATLASTQELQPARDLPLTLDLLAAYGATLENLQYTITVANRKAQRRTGAASCAYIARLEVAGTEHAKKPLLAWSPHNAGEEPLVWYHQPIPLGHFQVIRPTPRSENGVNLAIPRVRFTPARGEVYGPPTAIAGAASPLPPGQQFPPQTEQGRLRQLVPPQNRILNPHTPWSRYVGGAPGQQDPQPSDSYDGAKMGNETSWGVVDDTCDGIIEARLVIAGERFIARTRVIASTPDFAPDRRPFFSFAEDLADRDCPPLPPLVQGDAATLATTEAEIADLFERVFETASQMNLDALRWQGIHNNASDPPAANYPGLPQLDARSMSSQDLAEGSEACFGDDRLHTFPPQQESQSVPANRLPYASLVRAVHAPLADIDVLVEFLQTRAAFVRRLIRPPFGRVRELAVEPDLVPDPRHRDPRVVRDQLHDMRMPPYIRDSDNSALSLSWRQYHELMDLIDFLSRSAAPGEASSARLRHGPLGRKITQLANQVRATRPPVSQP